MRPYFWQRRVRCLPFFFRLRPTGFGGQAPSKSRGDGAPQSASFFNSRLARRARLCDRRTLDGAPSRLFCPWDRTSGCGRGAFAPLIRQAFAHLHPHRVQPFKAAGRSASGRLPRASRVRGYEPRPRAPHHRCPVAGAGLEGSLCLISGTFPSRSSIIATSREDPLDEPGRVEYRPNVGLKSRGV